MKRKGSGDVFIFLLCCAAFSLIIYFIHLWESDREFKAFFNEVVKRGHIEYYLDENNQRQWRWK